MRLNRPMDFSAIFRSSVGFDALLSFLSTLPESPTTKIYPPYNIEKFAQTAYRITLAVAGFSEEMLEVTLAGDLLCVKGFPDNSPHDFVHQGICLEPFTHYFQLASHLRVHEVFLDNGLLEIWCVILTPPEEEKIKIKISSPK